MPIKTMTPSALVVKSAHATTDAQDVGTELQ